MNIQAILKAGGVGAGILLVLNVLGLIPCVGCITLILSLLVYAGVGVLAALWMPAPRDGASGAKNGAVAAVVAGLVSGLINMVLAGIQFSISGTSQMTQVINDLPPDQAAALAELGISPAALGIGAVLGITTGCCLIGVLIAAGLGAAGGYYWGNSHPS
ncbi:MAG: hypothetical protein DPW09_23450 [Anaerolineae bacterium]|nr:hypothetical protein [Anaerolineales bacterium]MCQ3976397.1 hypothetical protein [Anaerolineae bacterium]